jgi:hypothetical protein
VTEGPDLFIVLANSSCQGLVRADSTGPLARRRMDRLEFAGNQPTSHTNLPNNMDFCIRRTLAYGFSLGADYPFEQ